MTEMAVIEENRRRQKEGNGDVGVDSERPRLDWLLQRKETSEAVLLVVSAWRGVVQGGGAMEAVAVELGGGEENREGENGGAGQGREELGFVGGRRRCL
jgi:hypothetical protein